MSRSFATTTLDATVLLVEDDERLAALVKEYLECSGLRVEVEPRGDRAVARVLALQPDAVVLDIMLPGLNGLAVCQRLRPAYTGAILMLTARGEELDEIIGLESGADDYMSKPVRPRVLLARIQSLLRRVERADQAPEHPQSDLQRATVGPLHVDMRLREATLHGEPLRLTTAELELLWFLAERAGQIVSREELYRALRGIEYDGLDRAMDIRVGRLRKKLGDDANDPTLLKSVRGVGYLLVTP